MPIYADRDPKGKITGKWRAQVRKERRTIKSPRFETYQEAVDWEAAQHTDVVTKFVAEKRRNFKGPVMTLGDLYVKGSGVIWRGQPSEETSESRLRILIKMLGPERPLQDVTTAVIDELIDTLLKTDIKGSTVNRYLSILRRFLDWGREREFLSVLPVFDWQEEDKGRIRWIEAHEERRLYELLDERMGRLVRVAIKTGMRRGELLSLTPEQIKGNKVFLWKTKNKTSRTIPVSNETADDLFWLLEHGMPNQHQLRWAWDQAREAMGLSNDPYFVFHVCRHTCATRLVEANVNLRVIQKWMGHLRIETTIRYAQVKDTMLEDALTKMTDFEHTRVDVIQTRSIRPPKMSQIEQGLLEENVLSHCGRGGTGRRAGFRSEDDDQIDD